LVVTKTVILTKTRKSKSLSGDVKSHYKATGDPEPRTLKEDNTIVQPEADIKGLDSLPKREQLCEDILKKNKLERKAKNFTVLEKGEGTIGPEPMI